MSDTPLPNDVSRWPEDPYLLLGIAKSADRRELRSAYTKLIRVYKPEHFPKQFRRIRDAYEQLNEFFQYRDYFDIQENEAESEEESETKGEVERADHPSDGDDNIERRKADPLPTESFFHPLSSDGRSQANPQPMREDALTKAWRKAIDNDRAGAYRDLCELERRRPGDEALCVRLYWLLALSPKLDPSRDRRGWLARGLRKSGLSGSLMELYMREIQSDPIESLQPRCKKLLECNGSPDRLANFASLRWGAAGFLGEWKIIPEDLSALRERIYHADRGTWSRLLLSAVETLLWQSAHRANSLALEYRKEVDGYSEEHQSLDNEFYRCDVLIELASDWKKLERVDCLPRDLHQYLRDLLRESWLRPFGVVRPKWMLFWRHLVVNPRLSLAYLDRLYQVGPSAVYHLQHQVAAIYLEQHNVSEKRDREAMITQVRNFYNVGNWSDHAHFRNSSLFFCLRNQITLADFMELSSNVLTANQLESSGLAERVNNDIPLHCLIYGCLAFWT